MRFTLHGPTGVEVSTCCHRPSGGDVPGSVDVGVHGDSAGPAGEDGWALARLRIPSPAHRARLGRVRRGDLLHSSGSLVLQAGDELAPASGADAAVQASRLCNVRARSLEGAACAACHLLDAQVPDTYEVELRSQMGGGLLDPVSAVCGLTTLRNSELPSDPCAACRATARAGESLLEPAKPLHFFRAQAQRVEEISGRESSCPLDSAIYTHHLPVARRRDRFGYDSERDVPAAGTVTLDSGRGRGGQGRSGQAEAHPTDLWHEYLAPLAVDPCDSTGLGPDASESFVHSLRAPCGAVLAAGAAGVPGLIKISQRLLLHRLRSGRQPPLRASRFGQLCSLSDVARRRWTAGPPHQPLLQPKISTRTEHANTAPTARPPEPWSESAGSGTRMSPNHHTPTQHGKEGAAIPPRTSIQGLDPGLSTSRLR